MGRCGGERQAISVNSMSAWCTEQAPGQPGLDRENTSKKRSLRGMDFGSSSFWCVIFFFQIVYNEVLISKTNISCVTLGESSVSKPASLLDWDWYPAHGTTL